MELLSKRDQMDIVTKADVVIGVHGNGLTNAIWMKPGGAVIECASFPPRRCDEAACALWF
jgi:capsular polysaccharide biosynthesis protein